MLRNLKAMVVERRVASLEINSIVSWRGLAATKIKIASCKLTG